MKNILIEGHRGYCSKYPENTLISFEAAMELGVDTFEFDVWLTADKVPERTWNFTVEAMKRVRAMERDRILAENRAKYMK